MESEDDQLYIPQVKFEVVPKLKQEFETLDEVASFYNRYAKEGGFSTRSHTNKLGKDNTTVTRKEYVCFKQGDSKVDGEKRKRGLPKVGCKARIAVVRKKTGKYAVSVFMDSHNHPLTSPYKRHKQFEFFGVQAGGIENVGFTQRDLYNYGSSIREQKKGHDRDLLYMHFENEKEKDPSFVYRMESDEEKKFKRGLLHQRNHELREDHINIEEKVKTAMSLDIEDDMAKIQDVDKLPVQYILKRWAKVARHSVVLDSNGVEITDNKALFVRRTKLLQHATYAIDKAIVSDEASQLLMEFLDAFLEKFN
ncbi:hypothetical protein ACLB2K_046701 [Fragaria x ananassa]